MVHVLGKNACNQECACVYVEGEEECDAGKFFETFELWSSRGGSLSVNLLGIRALFPHCRVLTLYQMLAQEAV
jgi:hypothetical protein